MCFSPVASFITAGLTGVVGIVALSRTTRRRELPLAAMPLIFALQQGVEGLLWLTLTPDAAPPTSNGLVLLFLIVAEASWPVFTPIAALLIEPDRRRRRLMTPWLALGVAVSAYFLWGLLTGPHGAAIQDGHVVYFTGHKHADVVSLAYVAAATFPLLLSSARTIVALGVVILVGCVAAYAFYFAAFLSVWCYFAAAASAAILFHFERTRQQRPQVAA